MNSPYYQAMIDTIAEANPRVKHHLHEISNKYLKMEVDDYHRYIRDMSWLCQDYGCTLVCDGWTKNDKNNLVNFMLYCKTGTIFIKFVDTTGQRKDA